MADIPGASRHRLKNFEYLTHAERLARRGPFQSPHPEKELEGYLRHFDALKSRGVQVDKEGSLPGNPYRTVRVPATGPNPVRVLVTSAIHGDERARRRR